MLYNCYRDTLEQKLVYLFESIFNYCIDFYMIFFKKFILFFSLTLSISHTNVAHCQGHEFTAGIGFAQYYGDLNVLNTTRPFSLFTESFNPKNYKMSYLLGYRYNLRNWISFGGNLQLIYLAGYDSDVRPDQKFDDKWYRQLRNLNFHTTVNQIHADIRIEPLRTETAWDEDHWLISPYASGGLGFFHFNPKTMFENEEIELQPLGTEGQGLKKYPKKYSLTEIVIPLSLGVRVFNPERTYSIGLDFSYNFTFTDYIDDVSTNYADPALFSQINNPSRAAFIGQIANRNLYGQNSAEYGYITGPGQQRGNPALKDYYLTGQLRFSLFLSAFQGNYLKF